MARRGAILLELLLAVALLAMAGMAVYGAIGRATENAARARDRLRAADLAWSAVALVESGLARAETLEGPIGASSPLRTEQEGSGGFDSDAGSFEGWELSIETAPSRFVGLVELRITAIRRVGERVAASESARQLVRADAGLAMSRGRGDVEGTGPLAIGPERGSLVGDAGARSRAALASGGGGTP